MVLPQDGNWMWCFRGMGIGCGAGMDVVLPQDGNWMWCFRGMGIGCGASAGWELDVVLPRDGNCGCGALIRRPLRLAENSMWLPPYLNQLNVQRN